MSTVRLTMAQALVRYLAVQRIESEGQETPLFAGVFAIFGHGNVAGLGEALYHVRDALPTLRAHNEQTMAHAAIAFAKAHGRRRMMAATSSIGPGATNMVTAAALAHANRLPVLLLPGDTFATREPDPVLQQVEHFGDPTITVNDCFRPVSRYFDRITRPEQLLTSLPQAIATLLDPEHCGPATLALPQDVQTFAYDYPEAFFAPRVHRIRRPQSDPWELKAAIAALAGAERPLIIAGGGVHYADACARLADFAQAHGVPVAETQAGKGALPEVHPCAMGAIGVTGSEAANRLAEQADVILAVGTRLQDFTTGSRALFERDDLTLVALNVGRFDSLKHRALPLTGDARDGLGTLDARLAEWRASDAWRERADSLKRAWAEVVARVTADDGRDLPTDAQVIGAVNRQAGEDGTVVCAAGGLPGELHKLWQCAGPGSYHVEYGYSCMGYEIAGGLGVKMARPEREVFVMVGDGSYLMHNSELATSVMLGHKLIVVVLDNRGFGCINRLQQVTGGAGFNNLLADCRSVPEGAPRTDFAAHARALGCQAESVRGIAGLEQALVRARQASGTYVIALDTDPLPSTDEGGAWWDVAVPEVSEREQVRQAYAGYSKAKQRQQR
ncbi:MAG: 3D-(3,5/4)-trihydroxycyclohexane-1,2-dione acylhydrolase (decyclizing) [Halomonas sp.]|jgi:3D-(3,5/4)-trihydroxycyclohexane-1,2-dione acylhydrolase (decyclizing)|uniref:3D-(3,5/4)-trihydroxycyclohexane-1,2-dione acylhydrolase (Decyclizing) n=1 Tax=Billgrantia tianxiuensis TaxID=2497861 RepID=A0A6I6SM96_9GAMM|nr:MULTISPECIES: 3D-(3,5/4)-trihydroxycyclohexane-1,2-dione acylhydrolase (decyclizing) [Halomonas]MCE8035917.1 3D-(3,5/4)-trihydroxycyclohexane-1,2-dione acylhydrolase (decyclizing) [Halomonas sp. MCCC 1A11057]MDX5434210.1 3D-(3,5/4)-trihydroxycyclohexane-1,2-dione acylhydrolase (decyclizing) [Halomonas sp.]QHC51779.1 3D-(3,5/4)-trihydroxycyclohexane-1,2-dione acylhydrolase (decyclizing) [Halomonas tianxiuensis]